MKKIKIILILMCACRFTSVNAQESSSAPAREGIKIGIKGGLNHSNIYDTQGDDFAANPKLGFVGGAFLSIPIGPFLGVQPEFLFSQKGFSAGGRVYGNHYAFERTTTYFEIPILLQFKPIPVLTLVGGPQFAYLIHVRDVFSNSTITSVQETEIRNNNIRKNTLGAVLGADVNILPVVLSARIGWDLQNNNGDGTATFPRYTNIWMQGTVGFRF